MHLVKTGLGAQDAHPRPRLSTHCARAMPRPRPHRHVVARTRPYRGPLLVVSQACPVAQCRSSPHDHDTKLYHNTIPCLARTACRVASAAAGVATPSAVSWRTAVLFHDTKGRPLAMIQFFLYRDLGAAQLTIQTLYCNILIWLGCMRCASYRRPPRPCRSHDRPYLIVPGRVLPLF